MNPNELVEELLQREALAQLSRFRFSSGVNVWFTYRYFVLQRAVAHTLKLSNPHPAPQPISPKETCRYLWKTITRNPWVVALKKKSILFITPTVSNVRCSDGVYENRVHDDFAQALGNVAFLEISKDRRYNTPRRLKVAIGYLDAWLLTLSVLGRIGPFRRADVMCIEGIVTQIQESLGEFLPSGFSEELRRHMKIFARGHRFFAWAVRSYLRLSGTRVVFLEDAHYGLWQTVVTRESKRAGALVVEPQHGFVSRIHIAYNLPHNDVEAKLHYPDFYLTYGSFWSQQIRTPSAIVEIGSPAFEKSAFGGAAKRISRAGETNPKRILAISGACYVDEIREGTLHLLEAFQKEGHRVSFRPHPTERALVAERYRVLLDKGIDIDEGPLHETLRTSDFVFGDSSTVFYEAMVLGVPIAVLEKSTHVDPNAALIFPLYASSEQLVTLANKALSRGTGEAEGLMSGLTITADDLFVRGWRVRFEEFRRSW